MIITYKLGKDGYSGFSGIGESGYSGYSGEFNGVEILADLETTTIEEVVDDFNSFLTSIRGIFIASPSP
jgi:hypothetical protein